MQINWRALRDPHATTAQLLGVEGAQARRRARLTTRALARSLGVLLTETAVTDVRTGASIPLDQITDVTVTAEPVRMTGAVMVGPVAWIGQRGAAYLTVHSRGPVWLLPIPARRTGEARAWAAAVMTAAHAAQAR